MADPDDHRPKSRVRVLIWDERQPDQKIGYGDLWLGEAIARHLAQFSEFKIQLTGIDDPSQGLSEEMLDRTDVIVWWGHRRHKEVEIEASQRVVRRVLDGRLAAVFLHSAHFSRPFMELMDERAREDAMAMIPATVDAAGTEVNFTEFHRRGFAEPGGELSPAVEIVDGVWRLILPACMFPVWKNSGLPSSLSTLMPGHPVVEGLPDEWTIPRTEMFAAPFHVPKPDAVILSETWETGDTFPSASHWKVGKGNVFYFRPGHETYPIYRQEEPLAVLANAVYWLAGLRCLGD